MLTLKANGQLQNTITYTKGTKIQKLSANLYDINHCYVYSGKTPDDGQRNCAKHVELYSKNKCEEISAYSWFYYKHLFLE